MDEKIYSVKEIAKLANVSVATVSRVINQNGRFSKETEDRVKRIIKECKYEPNQLARGLRTSKARMIGVLVPDITNEFFAKIISEIQNNMFDLGYTTIIFNTNEDEVIEQSQLNILRSQQVSGLIYVSGRSYNNTSLNVPTVYIDRKPTFVDNENFLFIESDNEQGGFLATEALIESKCKCIACVSYGKDISSHRGRVSGYNEALKKHAITVNSQLIYNTNSASIAEGYRVTKEIIEQNNGVDGIFLTTDALAVGAIKVLQEANIMCPEHMRIVGFDDISLSSVTCPSITTIHQAMDEYGKLATDALISMMQGHPLSNNYHKISVHLVSRQTC